MKHTSRYPRSVVLLTAATVAAGLLTATTDSSALLTIFIGLYVVLGIAWVAMASHWGGE